MWSTNIKMTGRSQRNIYADFLCVCLYALNEQTCMCRNGPGESSSGDCVSGRWTFLALCPEQGRRVEPAMAWAVASTLHERSAVPLNCQHVRLLPFHFVLPLLPFLILDSAYSFNSA